MRPLVTLLMLGAAVCQVVPAAQPGFSFTGNFVNDVDKREFFFTLAQAGTVLVQTWSYAGGVNAAGSAIPRGGFDPSIAVFDSNGSTVAVNRDGGCGPVAADAVT